MWPLDGYVIKYIIPDIASYSQCVCLNGIDREKTLIQLLNLQTVYEIDYDVKSCCIMSYQISFYGGEPRLMSNGNRCPMDLMSLRSVDD